MVINLAMVKDGCWDDVAADIRAVREASRGRILKVIIECCLLTEEEKRMLCRIVSDSGADYIKTSTGFSTGGATADDVRLLRTCCPPHVKVKAAGGIASLADAGGVYPPRRRPARHQPHREDRHGAGAGCTERCRAGRSGRAGHDLLSRAQAAGAAAPVCRSQPLPPPPPPPFSGGRGVESAFLRFDTENT